MAFKFQDLLNSIQSTTSDPTEQAALLVGSYGETGWDPTYLNEEDPNSPGVYGAYQFTPPSGWGLTDAEALDPYTATPAIYDAPQNIGYKQAAAMLPASITNPAAAAEWIAIRAEKPKYDTNELATIESTNAPTSYGANSSYQVQNWGQIQSYVTQMQGGAAPAWQTGTVGKSGTTTLASGSTKGATDPFTQFCIELNKLMNPGFSVLSLINPSSWSSPLTMVLVRGAFAVGFAAVGIVGVMSIASGGKVTGKDLPGLVAGFIAGPEAGLANLGSKMFGMRPQRGPSEMEQARLALGQERLEFQRRKGFVSAAQRQQSLIQQASRAAEQQQRHQENLQERMEARQQRAEQFDARQQATATRFQAQQAARIIGLQQGAERIQQAGRRADISQAALAERVTSRISQARARGQRERRLTNVQNWREAIFPEQMGIQRRKQTSAEQRVQLRRETLEFNKWKAGFPNAMDDYFDTYTVAEED